MLQNGGRPGARWAGKVREGAGGRARVAKGSFLSLVGLPARPGEAHLADGGVGHDDDAEVPACLLHLLQALAA
ncbi:MAG: hypothetical protein ACK56I_04830, partial [bacterium]